MVKDERRSKFTRTQLERFERALAELRSRSPEETGSHILVARAQGDVVSGKIVEMKEALHPYEPMEAGAGAPERLEVVSEPSNTLIGGRIAQGVGQRELIELTGLIGPWARHGDCIERFHRRHRGLHILPTAEQAATATPPFIAPRTVTEETAGPRFCSCQHAGEMSSRDNTLDPQAHRRITRRRSAWTRACQPTGDSADFGVGRCGPDHTVSDSH